MKSKFTAPPYQPKWILQLQVGLLRLFKSKRFMVITTTGRKTGQKRSVPIDYVLDGSAYLAFNMGGHSNWYRNALANPIVTVEIGGKVIQACAEPVPVDTPEQLRRVLDVYEHERPGLFEDFFNYAAGTPVVDLMDIGKFAVFMRFSPMG
ncbi:MAG: nitroreductase family deazaflavin-dependent oxidoreductase [Anaerolineae bacterium]|nr:nitroreductase family deazaflavin-dependent oxidoreductase [Anaerolineae bacterium]